MKIGIIAPFYYQLPPKTAGGTETVVYYLACALAELGHHVTVFCAEGSKFSVNVNARFFRKLDMNDTSKKQLDYKIKSINEIAAISKEFDVIHNNAGILPLELEKNFRSPMVTTWHNQFTEMIVNNKKYNKILRKTRIVSISNSQRKGFPEANYVATVYNRTIDFSKFHFSNGGEYLTWLGRFDNYKGSEITVKISKSLKEPLVFAGSIKSKDQKEFFDRKIAPFVDQKQIRFVGEVKIDEKVELLSSAKVFLMPIKWDEPFGLVIIEAMACGTPVIAFNRGSVSELVKDGINGYVINAGDISEMKKKVKELYQMDPKKYQEIRRNCFKFANEFEPKNMAREYLAVYEKIINKK